MNLEEQEKPKWPKAKDHLNKTFLEEIAYKIWSTKGARFRASLRLEKKNDLSTNAIAFLSAYMIIFGLLALFEPLRPQKLTIDILTFASTAVSIVLLVFSQAEASKDFRVKSLEFHKCGLELSSLYNEIRIHKTLEELTSQEKVNIVNNLSGRYQKILSQYSNHEPIDYDYFKTNHAKFYELNWINKMTIKIDYYWKTKFLYHFIIYILPGFFILYYFLI